MQDITATPTPTETPTPTLTFTPTATYTPTLNYFVEVTTVVEQQPARIERVVSVGDYGIMLLLVAILVSLWVMFLIQQFQKRGGK